MSLMAELQQEVEYQKMLILDARKQNNLLKAENEKMRDIIIDMSPDVFGACEKCGAAGVYDVHECNDVSCRFKQFHDRMFEMGIEVES